MIGVPAYRFGKGPRCVSQLEAQGSRLGAVVDRHELPHAARFDLRMRRAAVSETEARVTLLDIGLMPAFQAPPRAQPPETMGRSPGESQADHRQLSGGHARRLRALTQAARLLAWKLETK